MLGASGRQTQHNVLDDFSEEVRELSSRFFIARETCGAESLRLLNTNQRFLKKLEDLKRAKEDVENRRNNYVDQTTIFALRDAELRYQKACLLDTEKEWAEMIANRHEEIKTFRADLEKHLLHYCNERRKTATLQSKVTSRTEEDRINALNSVAFCTYAQTIVDGEVKKLCASAGLPTTRNIQRIQKITHKSIHTAKQELQHFYEERIKEFKRQERILYGRGRDAADTVPRSLLRPGEVDNSSSGTNNNGNGNNGNGNNGNGNNSNGANGTSNNNGSNGNSNNADVTTAEMLVDTLENRVATKLVAGVLENNRPDSQAYRNMILGSDDGNNNNNNAGSNNQRLSSLVPAPPATLTSSSTKQSGRGGKHNQKSTGLRASALLQHQQQLMMVQQQQAGGSNNNSNNNGNYTAGVHNQPIGLRGNRRFSLLQNGELGPAVTIQPTNNTIINPTTKSGKQQLQMNKLQEISNKQRSSTMAATSASAAAATTANNNATTAVAMSSTAPAAAGNNGDLATTSKKKSKKAKKSKNGSTTSDTGNANSNVLYDPNRYIAACASDYVKGHALLDLTSPAIAEREERLHTVGALTCEARGKVAHLTHISEALDGLIMRQIVCLLTALTHNAPIAFPVTSDAAMYLMEATQQPQEALLEQHVLIAKSASIDYEMKQNHHHNQHHHGSDHAAGIRPQAPKSSSLIEDGFDDIPSFLRDDEDDEDHNEHDDHNRSHQKHNHGLRHHNLRHHHGASEQKKKALAKFKKEPLNLSAAHKILQLDCAQKEQDIHVLRDRIVLLLQRQPDSPPATAANKSRTNTANNNSFNNNKNDNIPIHPM